VVDVPDRDTTDSYDLIAPYQLKRPIRAFLVDFEEYEVIVADSGVGGIRQPRYPHDVENSDQNSACNQPKSDEPDHISLPGQVCL
jgi:hypothetical protein